MPHKHNAARRHHIPKMSFKVQNWPAYEAGLRQRGSLTSWIEDGALEDWQTCGQGGQARNTDAAIETSLMLRTAFKLPLRQTEDLMASVLKLIDLTISAPDHTTVSRRGGQVAGDPAGAGAVRPALHALIDSAWTGQVYGAGQWLEAKHGAKSRRKWRKLHLAVDAAQRAPVVAQTLDGSGRRRSILGGAVGRIRLKTRIARVTAYGAYDGDPTYEMGSRRTAMTSMW